MLFSTEMLDFIGLFVQCSLIGLVLANIMIVRRVNSLLIAVLAFLVVQSISSVIKVPLRTWVSEIDIHLARFLFYFIFAFTDILMILFISRMHRVFQLSVGTAARITAVWLGAMATLQVARYVDRYTADLIGWIYDTYIPTANMALVLVLCWFSIREIRNSQPFFGIRGS